MVSRVKLTKALSLVLFLVLLFPSAAFADSTNDFTGHWAEDSIKVLFQKGFVTGYTDGSFKPDNEINRAEFMAIVNRAFGFNKKAEVSFKDVKEGEWYHEHVARAVKAGYIKGFADNTMKPSQNITKQEAAVIIARILDIEKSADTKAMMYITDGARIPEWSIKGVSAVLSKGYINKDKDGSFGFAKPLTRGEMANAVAKSYVKVIKKTYAAPAVIKGGNIDGSVLINNKDITLKDAVIEGDLILGAGIGEGNVRLINVVVKGETIVKGGGANSIVVENCQFSKIIIIKEGNRVRILATGNTRIDETDVQSGAILESNNMAGEGFGYVVLAEGLEGDDLIELIGNFESVEIRAEGVQVQASGGTIGSLEVASTATGVNIGLANNSNVTTFTSNTATTVSGTGSINTANLNTTGTKIEVPVDKIKAPQGVTYEAPQAPPVPPSTGGSSGNGGSGSRDDDGDDGPSAVAITAIGAISGNTVVGQTLTAGAVTPNGATVTYQWKICNTADGTYTNIAGATASTYTLVTADAGKFIKVQATGTGSYSGTVTSAPTDAIVGVLATPIDYEAPGMLLGKSNTVALFGTTFADAAASQNLANWTITTGTTNLQVDSITRTGDTGVTIDYTLKVAGQGTGAGTITIKAKAAAVAAGVDTNVVSVVLSDNVAPTASLISATSDYLINIGERATGFNVIAQSNEATGTLYVVPSGSYSEEAVLDAVDIGKQSSAGAGMNTTIAISAGNAGVLDGGIYQIYAVDEDGNISAAAASTFTVDLTAPTATIPTVSGVGNNGTGLVITFSEALYVGNAAVADGANVKAHFAYDGTPGNYSSATYDAGNKTVTLVFTAAENGKGISPAGNTLKDEAGNAYVPQNFTYLLADNKFASSASIEYAAERIIGVNSTMEFTVNNWTTATDVTGTNIDISGIIPAAGSGSVTLKVRVKGSPGLEQTFTINARPATPSYAIDYTNEKTSAVVPNTDEYGTASDLAGAMNGTGAALDLTPGTDMYFRTKATGSAFKSLIQHLVVAARQVTPGYTIDYTNEKTNSVVPNTDEYGTASDLTGAINGTGAVLDLTPGTDMYFRTKATGSAFKSLIQHLVVAARPATPSYAIDYANEKTSTVVPNTDEYGTASDLTGAINGTGAALDLTPGTDMYFRTKATGSAFKSEIQHLVVAERPGVTSYTIDYMTEKTAENIPATVEYATNATFTAGRADGTGVKADLTPGTDMYFRTKTILTEFAGVTQTLVVADRPGVTSYTIDYTNEKTAENIPATVEYATNATFTAGRADGTGIQVDLTPGTDMHFRTKATLMEFAGVTQTLVVAARQITPGYTIDYTNEKTNSVVPNTDEYGTASDLTGAINGTGAALDLTPGTDMYFRTKATGSAFKSLIQHLVVATRPATPSYAIDYANEKTSTVVPNTDEYGTASDLTGAINGTGAALNLTPGTDMYFRTKATGSAFESLIQHLAVAARPAEPAAYTINYTAEKTGEAVPTTEEYATNAEFTGATTGGNAVISLTPGADVWFRVKATDTDFASVGVQLVVKDRPAAPAAHTISYAEEKTGEAVSTTEEYATNAEFTGATTGADTIISLTPGEDVWFRAKATDTDFASTVVQLVVAARPATPSYAIDYTNEKTSAVVPDTDEYGTASDLADAMNGTGAALDLTPGTDMYFRTKATGSAFKSLIQHLVVAARPAIPSYAIDYANEETDSAVPSSDEYGAAFDLSDATDGTEAAVSLLPGTDMYFRTKATGSAFESEIQHLIVADRPEAPATYTINYIDEMTVEVVPSTQEYDTDPGFEAVTPGDDLEILLTPGADVWFRVKATETDFASDSIRLVVAARPLLGNVSASSQTAGAEILLDGITITTEDGYEYSQDGGAWADIVTGGTFDMESATSLIVRKKATNEAFASEESGDLVR